MDKTLKEVHPLGAVADAIALDPNARYLVIIGGPVTHSRITQEDCAAFKVALAGIGIQAVVGTGAEFSVYELDVVDNTLVCSHCGEQHTILAGTGKLAGHSWPLPTRQLCPGSGLLPVTKGSPLGKDA